MALESTDLTIIEQGVGNALWNYSPTPQGIALGVVADGIKKLLFDDTPATDSIAEYAADNHDNIEQLQEDVAETNENIVTLSNDIDRLNNTIDNFIGFQQFFYVTIFTVLFMGYIGRRISKLFTWSRIKKGEGVM